MNQKISLEKVHEERKRNFMKVMPYATDIASAIIINKERLREVELFDTTTRDGMQMYRAFVNPKYSRRETKLKIFNKIMEFGIPFIEVGYPASSDEEFNTIKEMVALRNRRKLSTKLVGLSGTVFDHISKVREADLDEVHIFSSGSESHCMVKFSQLPDQTLNRVIDSIKFAIDLGFKNILFSFEDSYSADPKFLLRFGHILEDLSKKNFVKIRYNIPDTLGVANPIHAYALIRFLSSELSIPLDVHFHNDTLNAVQNSIFAVFAGASRIQGTFLGVGERTGNASLNDILVQMYMNYGIVPISVNGYEYELSKLKALCDCLSEIMGIGISINHPGIGEYAFAHASGIHANAKVKCDEIGLEYSVYSIVNPKDLGNSEKIVLGPTAGKSNHKYYLSKFGIQVSDEDLNKITLSDKTKSYHKNISDAEYIINVYEILKGKKPEFLEIDVESIELNINKHSSMLTFSYKLDNMNKSVVIALNKNGDNSLAEEILSNLIELFFSKKANIKLKKFQMSKKTYNKFEVDIIYDIQLNKNRYVNARNLDDLYSENPSIQIIHMNSSGFGINEIETVIKAFELIYNSFYALKEIQSECL